MRKYLISLLLCLICLFPYPGYSQVVNGTFDTDVNGWFVVNGTITWYSGTLQLTRTSGGSQYAYQDVPTEIGRLYKFTAYVRSGTSGDETGRFFARLDTTPTYSDIATFTSSSTWTAYFVEFTALSTSTRIYLNKYTDTSGTMLFDTVSLPAYPLYLIYYTEALYHEYVGNLSYALSGDILTIKKNGNPIAIYKTWYRFFIE